MNCGGAIAAFGHAERYLAMSNYETVEQFRSKQSYPPSFGWFGHDYDRELCANRVFGTPIVWTKPTIRPFSPRWSVSRGSSPKSPDDLTAFPVCITIWF